MLQANLMEAHSHILFVHYPPSITVRLLPLMRSNDLRIHPHKMVVDRVFLLLRRSLQDHNR